MDLRQETIRYLGYGRNKPDAQTLAMIEEALQDIKRVASPRCISRRFAVEIINEEISVAGIHMTSKKLSKNLTGCNEVVLMAATLGTEVDRLLNRNLRLHISKAAVIQAAAAAFIEDYIDSWQADLTEELRREGLYVRPRFSPGYGDLDLSVQRDLLTALDATKRIGITLSEGNIMIPEKSVSAILGLSPVDDHCHVSGCELCGNVACAFRRDKE